MEKHFKIKTTIKLFTILHHCGGSLSNVNGIHKEISTRLVFVEVKLLQTVFASNVFCLQGTQQVHAFVTPPIKKDFFS